MAIHEEFGAVLITGASTGIGRATALRLDRLGFRVFASVRSAQDAESLRSDVSERLTPIQLDVTDIWDKGSKFSSQITQAYLPQAFDLYGSAFGKLRDYFTEMGWNEISPEVVARAIALALMARQAKLIYYVGLDAYL
jgi:NAD(P)-dependent dehydrogenase (short-subunit alcohol dehydrogenase family)